jgi:hypothetical protein
MTIGAMAAGTALAYYVNRRRQRTGESYAAIVRALPGEARRWADGARRRAAQAIEDGRAAGQGREAQIERHLEAAGPSSPTAG